MTNFMIGLVVGAVLMYVLPYVWKMIQKPKPKDVPPVRTTGRGGQK